jgi:CheY-like chemotaxis protein
MSPARIVLVDDNIADVKLLKMAFDERARNYQLEVLRSGEDALRFVEEHSGGGKHSDPCVILLDLNLPQYDGLVVLKAIKDSPELAHISVVVLSGFASPRQREEIESLGAMYMQKPLELSDYFALGSKVIDICEGASAAVA